MKIIKSLYTIATRKDSEIKKIGVNTVWLVFDKIFRMGVGLVVGVWIARYFGPELFGTWNYVLAFIGLFATMATLGIDGIIVRDLTLHKDKILNYMGSAFGLRVLSGMGSAVICLVVSYFFNTDDNLSMLLIGILSLTLVLQAFDTIDLYFQSIVKSYYTVISKGLAFIIISAIKIALILSKASIIYFIWANVAEIILSCVFLYYALKREHLDFLKIQWNKSIAKNTLKEGWPLIVAGVLVMVYLKIDQVMLKELSSSTSVGIYSAAVKLSEIWYFIPVVVASSILPYLIQQKSSSQKMYTLTLRRMYSLFFWISFLIAVFMTLSADTIISILYGSEYIAASNVLSVHIWAGIFVFMGVASSQYLLAENIVKYSLYRTLFGAITNILLNLILIPPYQEIGAAYATLVSYFVSTGSIVFFKECRQQAVYMALAVIPDKRLLKND